jgi:hypothetical protein
MFTPQDPIVAIVQDNNDGTKDADIGSFSPFNVVILSNNGTSVIPAERISASFYSYGDTLPSDADVRAIR